MEETQYLWQGALAASHARGEQSTYNHIKAMDDEQKTVQELRGLFPTLKQLKVPGFSTSPLQKLEKNLEKWNTRLFRQKNEAPKQKWVNLFLLCSLINKTCIEYLPWAGIYSMYSMLLSLIMLMKWNKIKINGRKMALKCSWQSPRGLTGIAYRKNGK